MLYISEKASTRFNNILFLKCSEYNLNATIVPHDEDDGYIYFNIILATTELDEWIYIGEELVKNFIIAKKEAYEEFNVGEQDASVEIKGPGIVSKEFISETKSPIGDTEDTCKTGFCKKVYVSPENPFSKRTVLRLIKKIREFQKEGDVVFQGFMNENTEKVFQWAEFEINDAIRKNTLQDAIRHKAGPFANMRESCSTNRINLNPCTHSRKNVHSFIGMSLDDIINTLPTDLKVKKEFQKVPNSPEENDVPIEKETSVTKDKNLGDMSWEETIALLEKMGLLPNKEDIAALRGAYNTITKDQEEEIIQKVMATIYLTVPSRNSLN